MSYIKYIGICYALFGYYAEMAAGQITAFGGTILVVDHVLPTYIILGAEARSTASKSGDYSGEGDMCKIQKLDDHTSFSSSGRSRLRVDGTVLYDAWDTARSAFLPGDDPKNALERWAMATESIFYQASTQYGAIAVVGGTPPYGIVTGILSDTNDFGAITVTIGYQLGPSTLTFYHAPPQPVEVGHVKSYSTEIGMALFHEFWHEESDRARSKFIEARKTIKDQHYQNGDAEAFIVNTAIDTAVLWNNGRDRRIGGEASSLILEKNKETRWFRESAICQQTWRD
jgi:hypothetical protein